MQAMQNENQLISMQELSEILASLLARDPRVQGVKVTSPGPTVIRFALHGVAVRLVREANKSALYLHEESIHEYRFVRGGYKVVKIAQDIGNSLAEQVRQREDRAAWMTQFLGVIQALGHELVPFNIGFRRPDSDRIKREDLLDPQGPDSNPVDKIRRGQEVLLVSRWDECDEDRSRWFDESSDFGYIVAVACTKTAIRVGVRPRVSIMRWLETTCRALHEDFRDRDFEHELDGRDPIQAANQVIDHHWLLISKLLDLSERSRAQRDALEASTGLARVISESVQLPPGCTVSAVPDTMAVQNPDKIQITIRLGLMVPGSRALAILDGLNKLLQTPDQTEVPVSGRLYTTHGDLVSLP